MYENKTKDIVLAQNDEDAMTKLIQTNTGLIWSIVKRFYGRGYELEDLYQIGVMGFIKAIKRFDTNFEVQLSTYAVPYILGEIKRFIRDDGPVKISRSIKELNVKIKELQKEYMIRKGKEITIEELEKELRVSKEDIEIAIESGRPVESIYAESSSNGEDSITLLDKLPNLGKEEALQVVDKITMKQLIENLEEREKEIILLRYYKEKTQMQVAHILGITQVSVSRIERKILDSMRLKLAI